MKTRQIDPYRSAFIALYDYQKEISKEFPVDIQQLALQISKFEEDPIVDISAVEIKGFEAGLFFLKKKKAWAILYNKHINEVRLNFTIAHEVGHYFLHRTMQDSFKCHISDIEFLNQRYAKHEQQADSFASALLIPDNDFLDFVKGKAISKKLFDECRRKYNVSLTSILLKWIRVTLLEAVLLVEQDNKLLWARSSDLSFTKGVFFKGETQIFIVQNVLAKHKYTESIIFGTEYSQTRIHVFYKK